MKFRQPLKTQKFYYFRRKVQAGSPIQRYVIRRVSCFYFILLSKQISVSTTKGNQYKRKPVSARRSFVPRDRGAVARPAGLALSLRIRSHRHYDRVHPLNFKFYWAFRILRKSKEKIPVGNFRNIEEIAAGINAEPDFTVSAPASTNAFITSIDLLYLAAK